MMKLCDRRNTKPLDRNSVVMALNRKKIHTCEIEGHIYVNNEDYASAQTIRDKVFDERYDPIPDPYDFD